MYEECASLFLVFIGGRIPLANVEIHDVRWVVGNKIEDTFLQLRKSWFGSFDSLHLDSYRKVNFVDGYRIKLRIKNNQKKDQCKTKSSIKEKLWFVNIGGYDPDSMQEKHEFGLVVAPNYKEAKNKAKSKWLKGCIKKHIDDCAVIKEIDKWIIELILEDEVVEETNKPDWFGYMRI